jgi:hypothetical protein
LPRIDEEKAYDGAQQKIERLGLNPLLDEIRRIITGFQLLVKEETDANGGAAVRKLLDYQFECIGNWVAAKAGEIDWIKCQVVNGTKVCVGVEIQFSARSDLIVVDIIHLRKALTEGRIDVGILIEPNNRLGKFLTDRGPSMSAAKRHILEARAEDLPLIIIALEHDGPGPPLAKQVKRTRKKKKRQRLLSP